MYFHEYFSIVKGGEYIWFMVFQFFCKLSQCFPDVTVYIEEASNSHMGIPTYIIEAET